MESFIKPLLWVVFVEVLETLICRFQPIIVAVSDSLHNILPGIPSSPTCFLILVAFLLLENNEINVFMIPMIILSWWSMIKESLSSSWRAFMESSFPSLAGLYLFYFLLRMETKVGILPWDCYAFFTFRKVILYHVGIF